MEKNISLAQLAEELMSKAQLDDFSRVTSVGISRIKGENYYSFWIQYPNGTEDVIHIKSTI